MSNKSRRTISRVLKRLGATALVLMVLDVLVFGLFAFSAFMNTTRGSELEPEDIYRCRDHQLEQRYTLAERHWDWWGPLPVYSTTRDQSVSRWEPIVNGYCDLVSP